MLPTSKSEPSMDTDVFCFFLHSPTFKLRRDPPHCSEAVILLLTECILACLSAYFNYSADRRYKIINSLANYMVVDPK